MDRNEQIKEALGHFDAGATILRRLLADPTLKPQWPPAVPPAMVVDDDRLLNLRANQLLESFQGLLPGCKTFLDYRSEDDRVTNLVSKTTTASFYHRDARIGLAPNYYDLIVCWDVLEHAEETPLELLRELTNALTQGGKLLLRLHPWTSRHAAHQYNLERYHFAYNKAYWHLTQPDADLIHVGMAPPRFRVVRPLATYDQLIKDSGLRVLDRQIDNQEPEDFFNGEVLETIIERTWAGAMDSQQARRIMAIQFVDYLLQKAP